MPAPYGQFRRPLAGNVRTQGGDVLIRSKGQAYRRSDFDSIVVKTNADGSIVRVSDVARVHDGFQEDTVKTQFDGNPAALIDVQRVGDESALDISETVHDYIAGQQHSLPSGMQLSFWDDDAQQLKNRPRGAGDERPAGRHTGDLHC